MCNPLAQRAVAGFENTLLPDEAFVQTVAVNSPMRSTVIPSHLRYIEWSAPTPPPSRPVPSPTTTTTVHPRPRRRPLGMR